MHMMGAVLRHGSTEQKQAYMAGIADGSIRQPTQTDSNSLAWARPRVPDSHSSRVQAADEISEVTHRPATISS
jgi:hypothetical protein